MLEVDELACCELIVLFKPIVSESCSEMKKGY